jgi:hypothetical protein
VFLNLFNDHFSTAWFIIITSNGRMNVTDEVGWAWKDTVVLFKHTITSTCLEVLRKTIETVVHNGRFPGREPNPGPPE